MLFRKEPTLLPTGNILTEQPEQGSQAGGCRESEPTPELSFHLPGAQCQLPCQVMSGSIDTPHTRARGESGCAKESPVWKEEILFQTVTIPERI